MIRNQRWSSLRPVEFTIAAVALAILASAAAPTQAPNQIAANEADAIDALRTIAAAQAEFKAAVHIDTNCDGVGEYGYFAEMAGTRAMRYGCHPGQDCTCVPNAGDTFHDILRRPDLRSAFGNVVRGCINYHGYLFQMWLPDPTHNGKISAQREDGNGGKQAAPFPDPVNGAHLWCCYAWPVRYDVSGRRAFFVNQRGDVLEYSNRSSSPFSGFSVPAPYTNYRPFFDEAYSALRNMESPPRIGIPNNNGSIWWPVP